MTKHADVLIRTISCRPICFGHFQYLHQGKSPL